MGYRMTERVSEGGLRDKAANPPYRARVARWRQVAGAFPILSALRSVSVT